MMDLVGISGSPPTHQRADDLGKGSRAFGADAVIASDLVGRVINFWTVVAAVQHGNGFRVTVRCVCGTLRAHPGPRSEFLLSTLARVANPVALKVAV